MSDEWKADQVAMSAIKADEMDSIGQSGAANLLRANAERITELESVLMTESEKSDLLSKDHYRAELAKLQAEIDRLRSDINRAGSLCSQEFSERARQVLAEALAPIGEDDNEKQ